MKHKLVNRFGFPVAHVRSVLDFYGVSDLDALKSMVASEKMVPNDFYRIRGCGHKKQPGAIVRYLFPSVKSAGEQKQERIADSFGDGI